MAPAHKPRSKEPAVPGPRLIVLGLFLFSGASGLIYQVVWSRMFALSLGTAVYAVSTVLGVFMGGLALGSWLFGRIADRPDANGLRIYAWLELGIGAFALALVPLMHLSDAVYCALYATVADSFIALMAVRFLLASMILLIPSTLMGGTLPVLSRFLVRRRERAGRDIGTLYAVNTLGAVLGCFFAGFFMLEYLGVRNALHVAALLNFAVGITALRGSRGAHRRRTHEDLAEPPDVSRRYQPFQIKLALILYAFSGFAALAIEVLWTRSLMYFTSVDAYAFTAMLSAFLCGLGLGSLAMSRFADRIRNPLLLLGLIEIAVGLSAAASIPLFHRLYGAFASFSGALADENTLFAKIVTKLFCSFFIMLIPTLLMGAAFPLVSAVYVGARRRVGSGIGTLYALNTVGAVAGSVTAGFFLIPTLGLEHGILLCASIFVALGLVLCAAVPRAGAPRSAAVAAAVVGVVGLVAANLGFTGEPIVLRSAFFQNPDHKHELVFFHEGPAASLSVIANPAGTKLLNINGINTAINNHMDMQVHRMLSHLPMLLHPDPRHVLVVGFGMGSTPWGCCQHDVERVDVIELLRSEKLTAPIFEDINHGVLEHPKLRFIEGDGRNYLLATDRAYDVISFNAIHPRYSAYLYTVDFYRLCRQRMTADGVVCAWLTQNSMKEVEFRMLCRSFVEVFPHASLWYCNPEHFCLLGTMRPTRIDFDRWRECMAVDAIRRDLADSHLDDPFVLATRYLVGAEALADYVASAPLNTDDKPRIEFTRSSKDEERQIIERLVSMQERADTIVSATADAETVRARLADYERATAWLMKGQVEHWFRSTPRSLKSEAAFRRALLICPDNEDIRHNLAFSTALKRKVQSDLQAQPDHVGILTRMGAILMEEGRLREAEHHLVRALQRHGGFVPAAEYLGFVHLLSGNHKESIAWLQGVHRAKQGSDPRLQYALAVALERLERPDEAARHRNAALEASPDVAEWFELLEQTVQLLRERGRRRPPP